jgi:endonuclease/exonuclease/phosphatase (EEP) superfamily protein YafD
MSGAQALCLVVGAIFGTLAWFDRSAPALFALWAVVVASVGIPRPRSDSPAGRRWRVVALDVTALLLANLVALLLMRTR